MIYLLLCFLLGAMALTSDNLQALPWKGTTYTDLNILWWSHVKGTEVDKNPLFDETGALCTQAQAGPFWYLFGSWTPTSSAIRSCTIPCGKNLVIPLCNFLSDTSYPGVNGEGDLQYHYNVHDFQNQMRQDVEATCLLSGQLQVSLDGVTFSTEDILFGRAEAYDPFDIFYPVNSADVYFGSPIKAGMYKGVADGIYVVLKPLSPGAHTLFFTAGFYEVTYNLNIESC